MFFALFLYLSERGKAKGLLMLILSILSHYQTILLLICAYVNSIYKYIFKGSLREKIYVGSLVGAGVFIFMIFGSNIINKSIIYMASGFDVMHIIKPCIFMVFSLLIYKRNIGVIILMYLPLIMTAFILGGERIVIFTYFLFLFLSFKKSPKLNIYVCICSIYFIFQSIGFLKNVLIHGNGYYGV